MIDSYYEIIKTSYCNKDEWYRTKIDEKRLAHAKGYEFVKVKLIRSDTKGLRCYAVYGRKGETYE